MGSERDGWTEAYGKIAMKGGMGGAFLWVHDAAPGLGVNDTRMGLITGYSITHLGSGQSLCIGIATVESAMDAVLQLVARGDWTRSPSALKRDRPFRAAASAILAELAYVPGAPKVTPLAAKRAPPTRPPALRRRRAGDGTP